MLVEIEIKILIIDLLIYLAFPCINMYTMSYKKLRLVGRSTIKSKQAINTRSKGTCYKAMCKFSKNRSNTINTN